jgi:hypothetical protein
LVREIYRDVGSWLHDEKGITRQWEREMSEGEAQSLIDSSELYLVFLDGVPAAAVHLSSRRGSIRAGAEGDAL